MTTVDTAIINSGHQLLLSMNTIFKIVHINDYSKQWHNMISRLRSRQDINFFDRISMNSKIHAYNSYSSLERGYNFVIALSKVSLNLNI